MVNNINKNWSILHFVASNNQLEIAEFLLQNEANAEIIDENVCIPLHLAVHYGHVEMTHLLLRSNYNIINIVDKNWGYTALHEAVKNDQTEMCSLLLNYGADINIKNYDGKIASQLAKSAQVKHLLDTILKKNEKYKGIKNILFQSFAIFFVENFCLLLKS